MRVAIVGREIALCLALGAAGCASSVQASASDAGADDRSSTDADRASLTDAPPTDVPLPDASPASELRRLPEYAAEEYCTAVFRCCDARSRQQVFVALLSAAVLPGVLHERVRSMDAAQCPAAMAEVFRDWIFHDWIVAVERGEVLYEAEEAARCVEALRSTRCGDESPSGIWDTSCFRPGFGLVSRRMFRPVATPGQPCRLPRELGWAYVGTCAVAEGYCCVRDPADPIHCIEYDALFDRSVPVEGTCVGAAPLGAACGGTATIDNASRVCASPGRCGRASHRCVVEGTVPLVAGAPCYDSAEDLRLGVCPAPLRCNNYRGAPYRDRCALPAQIGEACVTFADCASGPCDGGVCAPPFRFCSGP